MYGGPGQGWLKPLMLWTSAALVVFAAHAFAAAVPMMPPDPPPLPEPQPVVIMIELAPGPQAPAPEEAAVPLPDADDPDETIDLARLAPAEDGAVTEYAQPLAERFGPVIEDADVPIPEWRPEPPKKTARQGEAGVTVPIRYSIR